MKLLSNVLKSFQINLGMPFSMVQSITDIDKIEEELDAAENNIQTDLVENAHTEAEQIIMSAQKAAKKFLEDARLQAEEMRTMVLDEAREQGYKEGHDEINIKAENLLKEAADIKKSAEDEYATQMASVEKDMVNIILTIVRKVIGNALEINPEAISSLVRQTLVQCKECETVILKISPEDYDAVLERKDIILRQSGYSGELVIKSDISLQRGGCIAETSTGSIDASVSVQLNAIEEAFYSILAMS
ncbi:MAG: FliH/SctL family protein [Clostridia bacterium]